MGEYVALPGVKTWYEVEGQGEAIVLLHGGFCTNDTWEPQRADLAANHRIFIPERRAHGHTPDVEGALTYDDMASDTIDFLTTVVGGPAHLVGWSDGGNVALLVAIARPDLVRKIVIVGSNFLPGPEVGFAPTIEHLTVDASGLAMFEGMYEAASPDGPEHWPTVVGKILEMWRSQPNIAVEDLARISAPTLVMVGDDDIVTLEHTIELYRAVPNSELAIVPGASHALLMEKASLANELILNFLDNDPVPTMMPVRRAPAAAHP